MKYRNLRAPVIGVLLLASGPLKSQTPVASSFFSLTPCRIVDTRNANGAVGGPALVGGATRWFTLIGTCGIPVTARAVNLNVTAVSPGAIGYLGIFPGDVVSTGPASAITFRTGVTRANNFTARLGTNGDVQIYASSGLHIVIDVSGYYVDPPGPTPISTYQTFASIGTFGPTPGAVAHLRDIGINQWITDQINVAPSTYPLLPLAPNSVPGNCTGTCQRDNYTMYPLQRQFFLNALYQPDQLRQRVAWALHKFIVVSGTDLVQPSRMAPYLNILVNNAFGNYRDILGWITVNPAMGQYLNMDTSTLLNPNENYAREILQLFSTGVFLLNQDGTLQHDMSGNPIPTYVQNDIVELSRAFTGWRLAPQPTPGTDNYSDQMVLVEANHDKGKKSLFCDWSGPAPVNCRAVLAVSQTGVQDVNQALDAIFNHPNVGPYVAGMLIRDLVTSNPSPAYVGRVAAAFNNNGSGVRGDLAAVVRAILTDPDAIAAAADPNFGSLRDPVVYTVSLLRALGARSADGTQLSDGVLAPQVQNLGQTVFQPDTVFGYYPADYIAPGTSLLGPEFGILSAITAFNRANLVNTLVYSTIAVGTNNPLGTSLDLSQILTLASDPTAMVEELNQRLCRGLLSASAKAAIVAAVNTGQTTTTAQARAAVYLVATSSQFQIER